MDELHRAGLALQQPAELDQADQHRIQVAATLGEYVFVPGALAGLLIRLLGQ